MELVDANLVIDLTQNQSKQYFKRDISWCAGFSIPVC